MISVIVCSNQETAWVAHRRHVELTIGFAHEYIRIDNTAHTHSLSSAYNEAVKAAKGEVCVFVHEDVFFLTPAWGSVLWRKFADPGTGVVGVAGTRLLLAHNPLWRAPGSPFIHGQVLHHDGDRMVFTTFSQTVTDAAVAAVDGLFMGIRRKLFETIRFDEETFDHFHFYDLDICMQAHKTHTVLVTSDILVKHYSKGVFDGTWAKYGGRFLNKYRKELPSGPARKVPAGSGGAEGPHPDTEG